MAVTFVSRFGKLWMFVSCLLSVQCHFFSDSLCQASFFLAEWHCDCMCSTCDTFVTLWHCVSLVTLWQFVSSSFLLRRMTLWHMSHLCHTRDTFVTLWHYDIMTVCVTLNSSLMNCDIVTLLAFLCKHHWCCTTSCCPAGWCIKCRNRRQMVIEFLAGTDGKRRTFLELSILTYLSAKKMGTKICQTWIHGNSLLQNICTVAHLHMCN